MILSMPLNLEIAHRRIKEASSAGSSLQNRSPATNSTADERNSLESTSNSQEAVQWWTCAAGADHIAPTMADAVRQLADEGVTECQGPRPKCAKTSSIETNTDTKPARDSECFKFTEGRTAVLQSTADQCACHNGWGLNQRAHSWRGRQC